MLRDLPMNGWRKRIGYISPSVHETTVHDFFQYKLTGVGIVGHHQQHCRMDQG